MIRPTQIIKSLKVVFTIAWYVNIILAGSAILFQLVNLFLRKKMLLASFMGQFSVESNKVGELVLVDDNWKVYMDEFMINPSLLIENSWSQWMIFLYSIVVLTVVLFYNYQFKELFREMNQSVEEKELFRLESIKRFQVMSMFSLLVFTIGSILSLLKLVLIKQIEIAGLIMKPVYDHQLFNLLWLAVGFYLIATLFKVGLDLKTEIDLTI